MNNSSSFDKLRNDYLPSKVKVLFVGESVPQNGTFFYNGNSKLYSNTEKAFIWQAGKEFSLKHFRKYGCWLYDVCDKPVNGFDDDKKRRECIKNGIPALLNVIDRYKPEFIIVVKKTDMKRLVFKTICEKAGYIENETVFNLPFPACGNELKYCNELAELIVKLDIGDDIELEKRNAFIHHWSSDKNSTRKKKQIKESCPVCGQYDFIALYESCPVCNWEYDPVQHENPDEEGGANSMRVNQARVAWKSKNR